MSDPHVDVIINNHDYGDYVGAAIESALAQTYSRTGVIVVDDGSTDHSRHVISAYGSDVVAVFKANGGQASAFNAGFDRSRADVVIFLDADDLLVPDTCARLVAAFEHFPSVARVQYRTEAIDDTGIRTGVVLPPAGVRLPSGDLRRHALAFPFDVPWVATSGNGFAASALHRIFPVPEAEFRILADWYVVHLTSLLGPVISLDEVGAYRRFHARNRHEFARRELDLGQLRRTIRCAAATRRELRRLAQELDLLDDGADITAFSDVANRLISCKLAPHSHPLRGDRLGRLLVAGARVALRRFDVSPVMRMLLIGWLITEALAPRSLARPLAELFLFRERRERLNPLLARWHRTERSLLLGLPDSGCAVPGSPPARPDGEL